MTLPDLQTLVEPLTALIGLLNRLGVKGVIVGGVAVSLLGKPRFTADVDAVVHMPDDQLPSFLSRAREIGFAPRVDDPVTFARRHNIILLKHNPTGIGIDISMALLPFEVELISRATPVTIGSLTFAIPTPEDLIIMKAVAHRSQDLIDIEAIRTAHPTLDMKRIRRWIREFARVLHTPEIAADVERIMKQFKKSKKGHGKH